MRPAVSLLVAVVASACGTPERRADAERPPAIAPASHPALPPTERAGGRPLSEVEARGLLSTEFRRAGLRILADVAIAHGSAAITADGYDPERRIGFEYIADDERGADLAAGEREALAGQPGGTGPAILFIDAAPSEQVTELASRFLTAYRQITPDAGPSR